MTIKEHIERVKDEVYKCVHCGFCLTACPTYLVSGLETESPRGRISLMKATIEDQMIPDQNTFLHWDRCIQCRACEPACPSGVNYGMLIESTKEGINAVRNESKLYKLIFKTILKLAISNNFINFNSYIFRIYKKINLSNIFHKLKIFKILPNSIKTLESMIPNVYGKPLKFGSYSTSSLIKKEKLGFFRGCIMPGIHGDNMRSSVNLLNLLGYDVNIPESQVCCGSLNSHNGDIDTTIQLAKANIDLFLKADYKYLIISAAGCGTRIKEYAQLFEEGSEYWDKSIKLKNKTYDIHEFLFENIETPPRGVINKNIGYQPACHLLNTQKIDEPPIELIKMIPGINFIPIPSSNICFGAGGAYSVTQPKLSKMVLNKKINEIKDSNLDIITVSNPGCFIQLQGGAEMLKLKTEVMYVTDLLYSSYIKGDD